RVLSPRSSKGSIFDTFSFSPWMACDARQTPPPRSNTVCRIRAGVSASRPTNCWEFLERRSRMNASDDAPSDVGYREPNAEGSSRGQPETMRLDGRAREMQVESRASGRASARIDDVQSRRDSRGIPLDEAGISDLSYPIVVRDRVRGNQHTIARLSMSVGLPHDFKGTHMSRF